MNTNVSNSQLKGMKSTNIPLRVGSHKGGLDLWVRLKIDGKTVREFPGHSFISQFAYDLHSLFHGGVANRQFPLLGYSSFNDIYNDVSNASNASPIRISIPNNSFKNLQDGDLVWVYGVRGNTNANGLRVMKNVSNNQYFDLYELDGVTPVAGNAAYSGGGKVMPVGNRDWSVYRANGSYTAARRDYVVQGAWNLYVGTKNDPVTINDFGLHDACQEGSASGQLNGSGLSFTAQVTDKPSSRFSVLKNFTNNSGATIEIAEIGLTRAAWDRGFDVLIARDVLGAPLSLPNNGTLSVEYEVITELQPDTQDTDLDGTNGGFTDKLLNRLRQIATDSTPDPNRQNYFNVAGPAARLSSNRNSNRQGWQLGIRLGSDNTYVSTTNENLIAQIDHSEDGLYYYGSNVENVIIDEANNKATFEINRIFENRSAAPITVKEVGLFGNATLDNYGGFDSLYLYARTALDPADQFTIQPGEFRIVRYTLEFIA